LALSAYVFLNTCLLIFKILKKSNEKFTCTYVRTKFFHEKINLSFVLKVIKFGVKNKVFVRHILLFYTNRWKISVFAKL
jgi:hypothetical protein